MKAIITRGLPGSGKSYWAENQDGFLVTERDHFREKLYPNYPHYKFSSTIEDEVTLLQRNFISEAANECKDIIIADTNLNSGLLANMESFLCELGYSISYKDFTDISLARVLKQNAKRMKHVPVDVIHRMAKKRPDLIPWAKKEYSLVDKVYVPDTTKEFCIIVDVDGTIANMNGLRSPYDMTKVEQDTPHQDVVDLVNLYANYYPAKIVIVTARANRDGGFEATERWLDEHLPNYDTIIMRDGDDIRKDNIVKEEMFWEHIAPKYCPVAVFDDRRQVVQMWKNLGLRVFQIHHPHTNDDF